MDMQTLTQLTLAFELAEQGLSHTTIAAHLGRHRETIGLWLKGIASYGLASFLDRHTQAKKGPRRARQVSATIKRLIWELRVREHDCCGQKIAYFLEREYHVRLSVPKTYEILAEKYVIRSKWRKNQKRGGRPKGGLCPGSHPDGYGGVRPNLRLHGNRYLHQRGRCRAPARTDQ